MQRTVEKVFFALIRFEIKGDELCEDVKNLITPDVLPALFKLSKRHDLAHLIGDALDKNGLLPDGTEVSTVELTLHEGRNRQIRRMCDILGFRVVRLCRISIGDIRLGNLPRGKWRHLTKEEVRYLKTATNSLNTDSEE